MLGFKEPSTAEASPETSPPPQLPPKERVTEFAAEIGGGANGDKACPEPFLYTAVHYFLTVLNFFIL